MDREKSSPTVEAQQQQQQLQHHDRHAAADPAATANAPNQDEPTAIDRYPDERSSDADERSLPKDVDDYADEKDGRPRAYRTVTTSTALSAATTGDVAHETEKRPWYRRLNPLKWGGPPPVPRERSVSREYGAGFFALLTFQWMAPLMSVGYQRPLELNDIWLVNPDRSAEVLSERLSASFDRRVAGGDGYPLLFALHDTFRFEFWLGGVCQLCATILQVITPFTLRFLIQFVQETYYAQYGGPPAPHIGVGLGLVFGITVMQMLQSAGTNHFLYRGGMIGGQARAVLIAAIFEKALKMSGRAKAGGRAVGDQDADSAARIDSAAAEAKRTFLDRWLAKRMGAGGGDKTPHDVARGVAGDGTGWSNGRVVNLMSTDTYRIDQASGMFHMLWTSPVAIVVTLVVLLINLSYSALAGFALLVCGMPLLTTAIQSLIRRRRAINKITDQRVTLTQEILQSVRFVKYFGWESSFLERIHQIRRREITAIQILLTIRNSILATSMSLPIFASMLSFITYSLTSHGLSPASVFSSLALFNSLRMPLNLLPMVIGQVTDAMSSLQRIQEFLLTEEQADDITWDMENDEAVVLEHADFTWERTVTQEAEGDPKKAKRAGKAKRGPKGTRKEQRPGDGVGPPVTSTPTEPFRLFDMDFSIGRKELVAVIGTVGSGKSSLLAALAGDMRKTEGKVTLGATRAFCPQYAWIQNASVKENVLFGKEMDRRWYESVIDACALRADLDMLPAGELTEIGERGITVSGGQKQRLNIARAIYFNSDIVIMDDPLSAVDAHVGRHIFDNAICGLLKDKCRILATHQLHVLHRCDRIVWLQEGRIGAIDTFENLMGGNEAFQKMMATTAQEESEEEEEEEEEAEAGDDDDDGKKDARKSRKTDKKKAALMQQEERGVKSVSWDVYAAYVKASGSYFNGPLTLLLLVLSTGSNIATSLWLSYWTSNRFGYSSGQYMGVYAGLGAVQAILMFVFSVALSMFGTTASRAMLKRAMRRVLRAPMSFFDTTPLGRITNRFAKDVDTMDNSLSDNIRMFSLTMGNIISVFVLIIVFFYYFAVALVPLLVVFLFSTAYYRASAREMKRHEAVLRSHVFARFSEAVAGTASIRAYGLQAHFVRSIRDALDQMNSAYYLTSANQRWLSVRLDMIGNLLVFTTGILVVTARFSVSPSTSGLVLSYILSIVSMIQFSVRQLAEVENAMNATERIHYYGVSLEEEAPLHLGDVGPSWPERGGIDFDAVQMRYRPGLPLVLQGFSLRVAGGERIGIVGRTGAGKSSIMSALFRLVELSGGTISIDGVDIAGVGLQDLRSRLAIIPQDPTLFRGTVRSNLDPFDEHTDLELWSALRQADLVDPSSPSDADGGEENDGDGNDGRPAPASSRIQLDSAVEEEGLNFSLGQRQLMALARALVRGSQIIVCDEATSSVDMETDRKIQLTMARAFRGKTLLCIAHRLRTIIGYDRICVMDQGRIAELDTPLRLWERRGGIFRGMCERSGIRVEDFDAAAAAASAVTSTAATNTTTTTGTWISIHYPARGILLVGPHATIHRVPDTSCNTLALLMLALLLAPRAAADSMFAPPLLYLAKLANAMAPSCRVEDDFAWGKSGIRISAIFVMLIASFCGTICPLIAHRHKRIAVPDWVFFVAKYFGSGVVLATAFIHLLAPASKALRDPCLSGPITEYDWAESISLMTIFVLVFVEIIVVQSGGHNQEHAADNPNAADDSLAASSDPISPPPGDDHQSHSRAHTDLEREANVATANPVDQNVAVRISGLLVLVFGVIFHSLFVGLTLAVTSPGRKLNTLYVVLVFHQLFEGLELGTRLALAPWSKTRSRIPYLLGAAYTLSTPIAIAIGLAVRTTYSENSDIALMVTGCSDSISAGILLYTGLAQLIAYDFFFSDFARKKSLKVVLGAWAIMCAGAALMAWLGSLE